MTRTPSADRLTLQFLLTEAGRILIEPLERRVLLCLPGDYFDLETGQFVTGSAHEELRTHDNEKPHGVVGVAEEDGVRLTSADLLAEELSTDPAVVGQWGASVDVGGTGIHTNLLPTGKVSWWDFWNTREMDPATMGMTVVNDAGYVVFCSGHSFLPDGRLLVTGGQGDLGDGLIYTSIYDPVTHTWSRTADMYQRRWYPTNTVLPDGDVLVVSGRYISGYDGSGNPLYDTADLPQIYDAQTNAYRDLTTARRRQWLYPWMFLTPDGRVFDAGPGQTSQWLDTSGTGQWTVGPSSNYGNRDYGSAVMYEPGKVLILGGSRDINGQAPTNTAETIDLNAASPSWQYTGSMQYGRRQTTATILADGTVLVTGGSSAAGFNTAAANNTDVSVYAAELWDPNTGVWTTLASMAVRRLYHSTAILLPDGRVLSMGGGHPQGSGDLNGAPADANHNDAEIYSPPYLFKGARPTISSAPSAIKFGGQFAITSADAASIARVTLVRLGSMTHDINMEQRFDDLAFSTSGNTLTIQAPTSANQMPPGPYMLFVINGQGVPSVAAMMNLGSTAAPTVASLSDSPDPVSVGNNTITLTANSVADTDGSVSLVQFYRETNGTAGLQTGAGGDTSVGSDNNATGGWTSVVSVSGLALGNYTYYAQARDNHGVVSNVVSTLNTVADQTAPAAVLGSIPTITSAGGTFTDLVVTYSDNVAVDVSDIDSSDLTVTDPQGNPLAVSFVSVNTSTDGTPRTATYRLTAPGGTWGNEDNGSYTVVMAASQVSDTSGNLVAGGTLGGFSVSIASAPTQVTLRAIADAYVRGGNFAGNNYGQVTSVQVSESTSAKNRRESYLRFDLSGVTDVTSATLRLFGRLSGRGSAVTVNVYTSSNTTWTENGINNNNKPAAGTTLHGALAVSGTTGQWYELNLTSLLQQLKGAGATAVTLVLKAAAASKPYVTFNSDEASSNQPQLVIAQAASAPLSGSLLSAGPFARGPSLDWGDGVKSDDDPDGELLPAPPPGAGLV